MLYDKWWWNDPSCDYVTWCKTVTADWTEIRSVQEIQHQGDSELVALKMEGPYGKDLRVAYRNWEQPLIDTTNHLQELNSSNYLNECGSRFFHRTSRKSCSMVDTHISPCEPWAKNPAHHAHTSDLLQNFELIDGCCFKSLKYNLLNSNTKLKQKP